MSSSGAVSIERQEELDTYTAIVAALWEADEVVCKARRAHWIIKQTLEAFKLRYGLTEQER